MLLLFDIQLAQYVKTWDSKNRVVGGVCLGVVFLTTPLASFFFLNLVQFLSIIMIFIIYVNSAF